MPRVQPSVEAAHLEICRRYAVAYDQDPMKAMLAVVEPEIEFEQFAEAPGEQIVRHGKAGVRAAMQTLLDAFDDFRAELLDVISVGEDTFVAVWRHSGRGHASKAETQMELSHVITLGDLGVVRWRVYMDRDNALRAARAGVAQVERPGGPPSPLASRRPLSIGPAQAPRG